MEAEREKRLPRKGHSTKKTSFLPKVHCTKVFVLITVKERGCGSIEFKPVWSVGKKMEWDQFKQKNGGFLDDFRTVIHISSSTI